MDVICCNPDDSDDPDDLREAIENLREMVYCLQGMNHANLKIQGLLERICDERGQQVALLKEQISLLKRRVERYETAFSAKHYNDVRRLN